MADHNTLANDDDKSQKQPHQLAPDVPPHVARVLEMITDAFIALDGSDNYVYINHQAEKLLGRSRKELLGMNVWSAFPEAVGLPFQEAVRRTRAEQRPGTCENFFPSHGIWIENQLFPTPEGLLFVFFHDTTVSKSALAEARRLNTKLSEKVEEFQALFDMLPVAVLVAEDPECSSIRANPAGERLLTVSPDENVSMSAPEERRTEAFRVMRDGRDVPAEELPMQVAAATGQQVRGSECLIVRSDGSESVLYGYSSPLLTEEGKTRGSIGAFLDVTPLKRLEAELQTRAERLRQSETGLRALLESAPVILYAADADGTVTLSEGTGLAALGLTPGEAVGRSVFEFSGGDPEREAPTRRALAGESVSWDAHVDGTCLHTELRPVRDRAGTVTGIIGVCFDVTERARAEEQVKDYAIVLEFQNKELEKANAKLAVLATMDGLTGLANHAAFQERLAAETRRATRRGTPLSLVLLDVDEFKQYNDSFGHPAGDEVLRTVGRILSQSTREGELAARYGGEEFVLILPQTDVEGAAVAAERVRQAIEGHEWATRRVTASFGVAALCSGGEAQLIARADLALYRAKSSGRNRVAVVRLGLMMS